MLPGVKFPGEEIVCAALTLVREQGDTFRVRAVHSYARRAERAERVRSGTGLQNAVRHLSDPLRSRGCVRGISPAASAAVDKRGKLCQNGKNTEGD